MSQYSTRFRAPLALVAALAALTTIAPGGLVAQDEDSGPVRVFTFSGRPRIGVRVDTRADAEKDKVGARIDEVTEDGPADKAGLKKGDIITRFNGTALGGVKAEDDDDSGPGMKLISLARKLEDGDTVDVEYRRGSETRKAKIVASDLGGMAMSRWSTPGMRGMVMPRIDLDIPRFEAGPNKFRVFGGNLLFEGGLDLADLNPDLGEYFGAKEGVLVLRTPSDSANPLKAGDVIVSIDGRSPKSEAQARRILSSYEPGETAKIEVIRKKSRMTLTWKPSQRDGEWKIRQRSPKVKVERS